MKRTLCTAIAMGLLTFCTSNAKAQSYAVDRGSMLLDGSAGFTSDGQKGDEDRTTQLTVNPSLQYFVVPGLAVGGSVLYNHYRFSEANSSSTIGIGPAVSYYFGSGERSWYPFVSAQASLTSNHTSSASGAGGRHTSKAFSASGGMLFMLSREVGVNGRLFYTASDLDSEADGLDHNIFGVSFGVTAFLF